MEQFVIRMLSRHGYTVDITAFKEFGNGEWVTWVKEKDTGEDYLAVGMDEQFVILRGAQQLKGWLLRW